MKKTKIRICLALLSMLAFGAAGAQSQLQLSLTTYYEQDGNWQPLGGFDIVRSIGPGIELDVPNQLIFDEGAVKVRLELAFMIDGRTIDPLRLIVRPYDESMAGYSSLEQKRVHPAYPIQVEYGARDLISYNQLWIQVFLPEAYQRQLVTNNQIFVVPFRWAPITRPAAAMQETGLTGYGESGTRIGAPAAGDAFAAKGGSATDETVDLSRLQGLYAIELYAGGTQPNVFTIRREAGVGGLAYFEKIDSIYLVRIGFFTTFSDAADALSRIGDAFPQAVVIQEAGYFANADMHRGTFGSAVFQPQAPPSGMVDSGPVFHTVREGETLYAISRQYDIPLDDIRRRNSFGEYEVIIPGQRVRLR